LGELCHRAQFYDLENEPMNACETASGTTGDLRLGRRDGLFTLETRLFLPRPLEIVFPFFADAGNLEILTPPWLRFEIVTPRPIAMRAGALIEYRLRLHGVPLRWQSEITAWEPPHRFVDEQRRGPYRAWIHEHTARCGTSCVTPRRVAGWLTDSSSGMMFGGSSNIAPGSCRSSLF
jgi:ligand-binding SRPBCC domain-containing protein